MNIEYFIPYFNSMRLKTIQVRVCSAFNIVEGSFPCGTKEMIMGNRDRGFNICRSNTILYCKELEKPTKPSSIIKAFPPEFLINLVCTGSFSSAGLGGSGLKLIFHRKAK